MLLQQVLRAHRMFLLHHGTSLADIFVRVGKPNLCNILRRFWDAFVAKWDVLLHGNPTAEVFSALKLSAGGELGIGVGEEEWGSGEREVLEDFIRRTSGLIDIVVSRFGAGEHRDPQLGGDPSRERQKVDRPAPQLPQNIRNPLMVSSFRVFALCPEGQFTISQCGCRVCIWMASKAMAYMIIHLRLGFGRDESPALKLTTNLDGHRWTYHPRCFLPALKS